MTADGLRVGDYMLEKQIGKGAFASVHKARNLKTGDLYAVKRVDKKEYMKNSYLKSLLAIEVQIMSTIKHPNILHLHQFMETDNNYYLVLDFCNFGDLEKIMKSEPEKCFGEQRAVLYLKQIINGFQ